MYAPNFMVSFPAAYPVYAQVPPSQGAEAPLPGQEVDAELSDFLGELMTDLPPLPAAPLFPTPAASFSADPLLLPLPEPTPLSRPSSPHSTGSNETDDACVDSRKIFYRRSWTREEDEKLIELVRVHGPTNWTQLATLFPGKNGNQLSQRWHKALDPNIRKGKWTDEEDEILRNAVNKMGKKWKAISALIPGRTGKQCRDRFTARLDPALKDTPWTVVEDAAILKAFRIHGNKWATIQKVVPHRSWYRVKWRVETLTKPKRDQKRA